MINRDDCEGTDQAACPYCGYIEPDSWELQGEDGITACARCGKEYKYHVDWIASYSTYRLAGVK